MRGGFGTLVALQTLAACAPFCLGQPAAPPSTTLVVLISGFKSDPTPAQIAGTSPRGTGNSGMYQLAGDLAAAGCRTMFFNWNGTPAGQGGRKKPPGAAAIVASIRDACAKAKVDRLVLVGHSWGGHTMLDVAHGLAAPPTIAIDLAIGVDPSSLSRGERMKRLPPNICRLTSFSTRNAFAWGAWKGEPRVENVDLGDPANGFMGPGQPNYAAPLDVPAHNATEWDERIHAAIIKRIARLATTPSAR